MSNFITSAIKPAIVDVSVKSGLAEVSKVNQVANNKLLDLIKDGSELCNDLELKLLKLSKQSSFTDGLNENVKFNSSLSFLSKLTRGELLPPDCDLLKRSKDITNNLGKSLISNLKNSYVRNMANGVLTKVTNDCLQQLFGGNKIDQGINSLIGNSNNNLSSLLFKLDALEGYSDDCSGLPDISAYMEEFASHRFSDTYPRYNDSFWAEEYIDGYNNRVDNTYKDNTNDDIIKWLTSLSESTTGQYILNNVEIPDSYVPPTKLVPSLNPIGLTDNTLTIPYDEELLNLSDDMTNMIDIIDKLKVNNDNQFGISTTSVWGGTWSTATYTQDTFVVFNGEVYKATVDTSIADTPAKDSTKWKLVNIKDESDFNKHKDLVLAILDLDKSNMEVTNTYSDKVIQSTIDTTISNAIRNANPATLSFILSLMQVSDTDYSSIISASAKSFASESNIAALLVMLDYIEPTDQVLLTYLVRTSLLTYPGIKTEGELDMLLSKTNTTKLDIITIPNIISTTVSPLFDIKIIKTLIINKTINFFKDIISEIEIKMLMNMVDLVQRKVRGQHDIDVITGINIANQQDYRQDTPVYTGNIKYNSIYTMLPI